MTMPVMIVKQSKENHMLHAVTNENPIQMVMLPSPSMPTGETLSKNAISL